MTNETELRDRIAAAIWSNEQKKPGLADTEPHPDCYDMAQAIIDEFGLHYVWSEEYAQVGLDWLEVEKGRHVVGKWEKQ